VEAEVIGGSPAPGKLDIPEVLALAKKEVGTSYEDVFVFTVTFMHLREIDRHLRDLNEMRRDMEWLSARLKTTTSSESPERAVFGGTMAWLEEEASRHKVAIAQLQTAVMNAKGSHAKAAAAAEKVARPTFGVWLEVCPSRS